MHIDIGTFVQNDPNRYKMEVPAPVLRTLFFTLIRARIGDGFSLLFVRRLMPFFDTLPHPVSALLVTVRVQPRL